MENLIVGRYVKKEGGNIAHFDLHAYGHRVNEKVYSIIEFREVWGPWAETVLKILERKNTLKI